MPQFTHSSSCCTVSQHRDMHIKSDIAHSRMFFDMAHCWFLHPSGSYYKLNINSDGNTTVYSSKSGILLGQYCQERWYGFLGLAVEHHLPNIHTNRHNLPTRKHNYCIYWNIWWPWKYHYPPSSASLFRKIPIFTSARFTITMLTASYQPPHMSTTC